jgi:hypothetical protein
MAAHRDKGCLLVNAFAVRRNVIEMKSTPPLASDAAASARGESTAAASNE